MLRSVSFISPKTPSLTTVPLIHMRSHWQLFAPVPHGAWAAWVLRDNYIFTTEVSWCTDEHLLCV